MEPVNLPGLIAAIVHADWSTLPAMFDMGMWAVARSLTPLEALRRSDRYAIQSTIASMIVASFAGRARRSSFVRPRCGHRH
jgi:hypothetical protein